MDLNYLYFRHQVSLMNAQRSKTLEARTAHLGLAALYADRISLRRRAFAVEDGVLRSFG